MIDIEAEFARFVPTFRGGKLVRELIPDQPAMALNADFYFAGDRVIAELKRMETDSRDAYPERVTKAYRHFGYTTADMMGHVLRGEPMPERVQARLRQQIANPLRQALRKANKQIAATKRQLRVPGAYGLALFANDSNFALTPDDALSILSSAALGLTECHVDGFVYMTPNVYHDTGDDIARSFWIPLYAEGKEALSDFVNPFGAAWIDYAEKLGAPYSERWAGDEYEPALLNARPIESFRRES
ncbi:MAG: hypothetical protein BGN94_06525 [Rhizobiales bacterium 68-8]|nr:MAG: hypothetical protein BGN94_06525 [Rhizobiales bacterium 68-8]